MKSDNEKLLLHSVLSLFLVTSLVFVGCVPTKKINSDSSSESVGEITLEGVVLTNGTIFITKSISSEQLKHELISIQMPDNNEPKIPGSLMEFIIESQIRDSYPMQGTGVLGTVLQDTTQVIKGPINAGPKIISHMLDDAYFIDVRTPEEFANGYIEGAINLPVNDLETLIENEVPDKNKTILLYCRSGNRSATAGKMLKNLGYTIVFDLGGINDYQGDLVTEAP